ncbi:helix-turn-helix transcriptional regulator [Humibacter sp.]|uniref:helix-turn-helix transcriptional regulator n=1 Tax=Humibacter sp. TaxID=1940291 RepID=UPI002BF44CCB|nr:helix-turn-helix transcriptional regulator [Humibacter sp.]HVX08960.1 helix-turn-helix transcriptional regulator [Humibacter sp.]
MQQSELAQVVASGDWDGVVRVLDESFYFYLFTDPALLDRVFTSAGPQWYEDHPRNALRRAIAVAAARPVLSIDDHARERFAAWVASQRRPAARDLMVLRQIGMGQLVAAGRYGEAAAEADRVWELVRNADDMAGFHDVLPSVLLLCGTTKLLVADTEGAVSLYAEALRWATMRHEHPWAPYARQHLALAYALAERYRQARELLEGNADDRPCGPGTVRFHYQQPGLMAKALCAAVAGDSAAGAALEQVEGIEAGTWWWMPVHVRAITALLSGPPWDAIHEIGHVLLAQRARSAPRSLGGAALRADLVTLYQSAGDLRHAQRVLETHGINTHWSGLQLARARQAWLMGDPEEAIALLQRDESTTGIPLSHQAGRAVVYAESERAASGSVAPHTLEFAAASIDSSGSRVSLTQASPALRTWLGPLLAMPVDGIPVRFQPRRPPRFTRREREVLNGLAEEKSIAELATALHLSPNTVKSHVRGLYRKLGAHNREEALWLARITS